MRATYDDETELVLLINGHGRQRCSFANEIKSSVFVPPDKVQVSLLTIRLLRASTLHPSDSLL